MEIEVPAPETPKQQADSGEVYKSVYNGVSVYEFFVNGYGVMRRCKDNFINATHILTVAGLSKGQRTKVLDNYASDNSHYERVQGGYGRYQGTWIPMDEAASLAKKYTTYSVLEPLFCATEDSISKTVKKTAVKKSVSPAKKQRIEPQIQKQARIPRESVQRVAPAAEVFNWDKKQSPTFKFSQSQIFKKDSEVILDNWKKIRLISNFDKKKMILDNLVADGDLKELYALLCHNENDFEPDFEQLELDVDMAVDSSENTCLHYAVGSGNLKLVDWLVEHGADSTKRNCFGQTALFKAVSEPSNYKSKTFISLLSSLETSIYQVDLLKRNLLHQSLVSMDRLNENVCLYYINCILEFLDSKESNNWIEMFLSAQDADGNTPLHLAFKYRSQKAVEALQEMGARFDIRNLNGLSPLEM